MSVALSPRAIEIVEQTKLLLAAGGYHAVSYTHLTLPTKA